MNDHAILDPRMLQGVPAEQAMASMIQWAVRIKASDLFFCLGRDAAWVAVRQQGVVRRVCDVAPDEGLRLIGHLKAMAGMKFAQKQLPADGRWTYILPSAHRIDLRINTMPTLWGEEMTVRILQCGTGTPRLSELGFSKESLESLRNLLNRPNGLLLVTGPTGAGKSTTLYGCLHYLNDGHCRIITIEDPIEREMPGIRQSQVHPEYDLDFPVLLRSVLRQAPDVVMIGEIRDATTAETAVRAANSGHLVLATIHAAFAAGCIDTMLCYGVHPRFLASSLLGAVSQRLVRRLCDRCKAPQDLSSLPLALEDDRPWLDAAHVEQIYIAKGCEHCSHDGYTGRMAVAEVLCASPEVRRMINDRVVALEMQKKAVELGMIDLHENCLRALANGLTSAAEVTRVIAAGTEDIR